MLFIKYILVNRVTNTERLAGIIIKILKILGIAFIIFLIIDIITLIIFVSTGKVIDVEGSATTICQIEDKRYEIEFGTNKYFNCDNCSETMNSELKKLVDFDRIDTSMENIEKYFISHHGSCN